MVTRVVAGRAYDFSHAMGRGAASGMGFSSANALTLAADNAVFVLNRGGEAVTAVPWNRTARGTRVSIVNVGSAAGAEEFLGEFGRSGDGDGEFIWPAGIALDAQDRVYVTDEWLNRVCVFDRAGNLLRQWGQPGSGPGEMDGPCGIVIDPADNLYIVDSRNHRIQSFTAEGQFIGQFGSPGSSEGQFNTPWGLAQDAAGCLYVADCKNHRVQKFSAEGRYLAQFGSYGMGRGELNHPSDVAVDADGDVYVCDWGNDRVQAYDAAGNFFTSFVGDARQLTAWSQMIVQTNPEAMKRRREVKNFQAEWKLRMPRGVAFDQANNRLLILDTQRSRIQIYNKLNGYTSPARNL